MAELKSSFIIYNAWYEEIKKLSDNEVGVLFKSILRYTNGLSSEETDLLSPEALTLYNKIVDQIEFEWSKYNPKTGKYHWNYQGGITEENHAIRESQEYKNWRINVFERDGFTCQNCKAKGGELNAHHIKPFAQYPNLRTELSNGITLCRECHLKEHTNGTTKKIKR